MNGIMKTLFALLVALFGNTLCAQIYDWTGPALPGVQINVVAFRGWIHERTEPLRGTLVLIPGRHGDGRGMAADPRWQQLAGEIGFAVIGCQFTDGEPFLYQGDEHGEVARAINTAVEHLSVESKHPELARSSLAFWGTSAGSNVSARYCSQFPARVAAFVSSKGTCGPGSEMPPGKSDIPMFFALGARDKADWLQFSQTCIENGIKMRAPWTLAFHRSEGHGVQRSLDAAIPFLKAAIELRFTPRSASTAASAGSPSIFKSQLPTFSNQGAKAAPAAKLYKIDPQTGWLGDRDSYEVAPYREFKGNRAKAIWLPDEASAIAWQTYLRTQ